jgi:transposase-like protein
VALVERGGGLRAMPVDRVTAKNLKKVINEHVSRKSRLHTDEFSSYGKVGKEYATHETVCHSEGEYARGDVNVNSAESFFALLKRGIHGTFHHVSKKHLHRYCAEFAWRWSNRQVNDGDRTERAIFATEGKRLTYRATKTA